MLLTQAINLKVVEIQREKTFERSSRFSPRFTFSLKSNGDMMLILVIRIRIIIIKPTKGPGVGPYWHPP